MKEPIKKKPQTGEKDWVLFEFYVLVLLAGWLAGRVDAVEEYVIVR